jgi:MFS family permease
MAQVSQRAVWQTGLVIVVSGVVIAMVSFGPRSAMGLFLQPMTEARGWSREAFALSLALQNLLWGIGQPFAGMIADRFGTGRVLVAGGLIYAAGLILMAWAPTVLWLNVSAGILIGIGIAASSFAIVLSAFARLLDPKRQLLAFGIGTAAGSMGQFVFAPLGQQLIASYGWEQALVILGVMMLVVPLFAVALKGRPAVRSKGLEQSIPEALREAFGHRSYVLLVVGFFVCGFQVAFIAAHLPAYIVDVGLDATYGAWAIAVIGLFNVIGALSAGVLGSRYSKPIFLAWIYIARSVAIAVFLLAPVSPASVLLFSAAMGLLWLSTVPLTSGLVAIMFGPRYMATLFGFVFFSHQLGSFLGVWLGGRFYDLYQSYDIVWWLGVALGIFAAIVHWPIQERAVERPQAGLA